MTSMMILGIESSCDDTAAAVLRGKAGAADVLSSVVMGQTALHADFGGVVPEIAARAHAEKLDLCVNQALREAGVGLNHIFLLYPSDAGGEEENVEHGF